MSRRVLGDDPFAQNPDDSSKAAKKPEKPASEKHASKKADKKVEKKAEKKPRASVRPPASPSTPPPSIPPPSASPPETLSRTSPPSPFSLSGEGEPEHAELKDRTPPSPDRERGDGGARSGWGEVVGGPVTGAPSMAVEAFVAQPEARLSQPPDDPDALGAVDLPPDVARAQSPSAPVETQGPPVEDVNLEDAIRDLESRLDKLLQATRDQPGTDAQPLFERVSDRLRAAREGEAARAPEAPATAERGVDFARLPKPEDRTAAEVTRELFTSDYYLRQWGRVAMRERAEEVDEFGYDPDYEKRWQPLFDFLYERWWRVEAVGVEKVPADGRVALVANHSGAVPYDGMMLAAALRKEHPAHRAVRWLADDYVFHLPFVGAYLTRLGAVRACQENAERLLRKESCVGIFPEGVKGVSKLYRDRYQLQRFGRGGHIKLALRMRAPVIPVTIVGAEETHPLIAPSGWMARMLGVPYVPLTPTFPWLGALGLIPAPSKWRIIFGDPMPMDGYSPDAAEDEVLVGRLNEKLRATIQDTLDRALRERRSIFRGWTSSGG